MGHGPERFEQGQLEGFEPRNVISVQERSLTELDHLLDARLGPNSFDESVLSDIYKNLFTAVQEAAMPYAVTTTEHEVAPNPETGRRTTWWLGRTAVQNAMSGYQFHEHPNALRRVDVEVDEARFRSDTMQPGVAYVFESPKMSRKDASLKDAQSEHLGDDDAVRVSWLKTDPETGEVTGMVMQSLLVKDIPLSAWVNMMKDPSNIYGKAIPIADEESALSVMEAYREMVVELDKLPEGPVTILKEVSKYIEEPEAKQKVLEHIGHYKSDQETMKQQAEFKAERWLAFERQLAESMATGRATSEMKAFIATMQTAFNEDELLILGEHALGENLEYRMTRKLAAVLENLKRNTLWGGAAALVGNIEVRKQFSEKQFERLQRDEQVLFAAYRQGSDYQALEASIARSIGMANIKVGGGCPGGSDRSQSKFKMEDDPAGALKLFEDRSFIEEEEVQTADDWESRPESRKYKKGICQVKSCHTRPGKTDVGPCSVCKSCQAKFDRGEDPTKEPAHIESEARDEGGRNVTMRTGQLVLGGHWREV